VPAPSEPQRASVSASPDSVKALVAASNTFALDLYAHLRESKGDLFFSPYSIWTALAMTSAGAGGRTQAEMTQVLHLPRQADLHPAVAALTADLHQRAGRNVELPIANALWVQKDRPFRDDFLALAERYYHGGVHRVDFISDSDSACRTINGWTAEQTRQRIRDLLSPEAVTQYTRLVLTNAVYFKGAWDKKFGKEATKPDDFYRANGPSVKLPMMHQAADFSYAEAANLQVLEMPYAGKEFSLVVLLPQRGVKLADVEAALPTKLNEWLDHLLVHEVIVTLPKFEMATKMSLAELLKSTGMSRAFDTDAADFTGIADGRDRLFIRSVTHKAFLEVSEEGTQASAASAVAVSVSCPPPLAPLVRPPEFTADRPFVYLLRDRHTGVILFLGRYLGG
jgi:serpin B